MALTSTFRRRHAQQQQSSAASSKTSTPTSTSDSLVDRGLPFLWPWVADRNRSKLRGITLAHILSGDTVSPISLSDFEAFLAFCDISVENLQFIVWYQDYRTRFDALPSELKDRCPPLGEIDEATTGHRDVTAQVEHANGSASSIRSSEWSHPSQDASGSKVRCDSKKDDVALSLDLCSLWPSVDDSCAQDSEVREDRQREPSVRSSKDTSSPPPAVKFKHTEFLPFEKEIQDILATFFVPGARKELSLTAEMRECVIRQSTRSTHPDIFSAVYENIYESVESVSLPRFLGNASTNINRSRQLFWYFSALPTLLLGIAIALIFILSTSSRFVVPPQSHRAWRLISVPCFMLSSMMWYKGSRGFCPLLFLRSSRQLRPWELEYMDGDKEAQTYCAHLNDDKFASGQVASSSPTKIAPFLQDSVMVKEPQIKSIVNISGSNTGRTHPQCNRSNERFRSRSSSGFHPAPIFGPAKIIEDKRIRAVHLHLLWSLVRFGLFWAAASAAIVVSVPSLH